jgi:hypothetical protein
VQPLAPLKTALSIAVPCKHSKATKEADPRNIIVSFLNFQSSTSLLIMGILGITDVSFLRVLKFVLVCFLSHRVLRVIYRIYFHPLSRFPGPKLTAATRWYEFYYQVVRGGRFFEKIEEMHEKYGA